MIADYPDSVVAIKELRELSVTTDQMLNVGRSIQHAIKNRLLHIGASTTDIIDMYTKMIKAFHILDPTQMVIDFVAMPVRKYLVKRHDTIRCIVNSLMQGQELHAELKVEI